MPRPSRPYTPPAYLQPGSEVMVSLENPAGYVRATVIRHLPFTWNQVVLCELTSKWGSNTVSLRRGSRFVLKLFDPRFLPRLSCDAPQWSYITEREAYPLHKGRLTQWCNSLGPDFSGLENWEQFYFLMCKTFQTSEIESYQNLAPLQGSALPIFYGHGTLDLSIADPQRSVHPPAILMEYIENAVTLRDVDIRTVDHTLLRSFISAVDRTGKLGANNNDLNPGNYLFAPAHRPTRILLIDWANAGLREPHQPDAEWDEYVRSNGAVRETKRVLRLKFQALGLPVPDCCI